MDSPARLMGLIDGAAHPVIYAILQEAGTTFLPLYAGLPEEALGQAGLFLTEIEDPDADWVVQIDRLDLQLPCLSLIWSRVDLNQLALHLRAFLFARLDDGSTALIRYFDPRGTSAVFHVWKGPVMDAFMGPIERWLYRGSHPDWQRIENDTLSGARTTASIDIRLDRVQLDFLIGHLEPDEMLASLIALQIVDGEQPYLTRFMDFWPRYQRAVKWDLQQSAERSRFCHHTYRYGVDFDRHPYVAGALSERQKTGEAYDAVIDRVPAYVWNELTRTRDAQRQLPQHEQQTTDGAASQ